MLGWSRWINYINPIAYGFESLMINEFVGQQYACSIFIPSGGVYAGATGLNRVCSAVGAQPGADYVDGAAYIGTAYQYYESHKWRNVGILFAFLIGLFVAYIAATEYISEKKSKGEVLVFRRGHAPAALTSKNASPEDIEAATKGEKPTIANDHQDVGPIIQKQTAIFHWQDVVYDIKIKKEERRILDHVDGWVRPGQLTALMGVSGAGKTTLLE